VVSGRCPKFDALRSPKFPIRIGAIDSLRREFRTPESRNDDVGTGVQPVQGHAGTHVPTTKEDSCFRRNDKTGWIPACAGMTGMDCQAPA